MATSNDSVSMALFCDFENVALGVRDAKYEKFDIKPVLERLLLKGSIVVKKAYCDWERYKGFKASMHEANFELIEIPHVRQSGKNSADIRLVVDALDLCYTKSHVDTFVIISGDSDFSPLVSKLRENAKRVIGVGVKQSTSDLLVANCDEFIFYDDLVREHLRTEAKRAKRDAQEVPNAPKRGTDEDKRRKDEVEARKRQAVEIAVETFDALVSEQGDGGKIWASVLKSAIKRRKPDFSESYYGFRAFGNLLEEARARGLLDVGRDERSGTFVSRLQESVTNAGDGSQRRSAMVGDSVAPSADFPDGEALPGNGAVPAEAEEGQATAETASGPRRDKRGRDRDRNSRRRDKQNARGASNAELPFTEAGAHAEASLPASSDNAAPEPDHVAAKGRPDESRSRDRADGRGSRRVAAERQSAAEPHESGDESPRAAEPTGTDETVTAPEASKARAGRKTAPRQRAPKKTAKLSDTSAAEARETAPLDGVAPAALPVDGSTNAVPFGLTAPVAPAEPAAKRSTAARKKAPARPRRPKKAAAE